MERKVKYTVTVEGRTLPELKSAIEDLLHELGGSTKIVTGTKKTVTLVAPPEEEIAADEEGMEEVESPFANTAPSLNSAPVNNGELDADNLPWDARIHASSREKKNDGTWRVRRNLDKAVLAQVTAELVSKRAAVQQPVQAQAPVQTQASVSQPVQAQAPVTQPVQQAQPPIVQPPMQNVGHTVETFKANFAMVLAELINTGKINQEYVQQLCTFFQNPQLWSITDQQKEQLFYTWVQGGIIKQVG